MPNLLKTNRIMPPIIHIIHPILDMIVTGEILGVLDRHNHSNNWVDDVNNRKHDPIGIEQVCHTKWWPTQQFTFICFVDEANAVYSRARGRKAIPDPQLEFSRKLDLGMLKKNLDD